ncbi:MAG: single-stranded-DNA-specific exonuclease RecJ [Candidatus Omnitrophica bacterium]|nr:single-stranded-DNA-specific exonuclease RecJ [Candidatus Omnitrophota bacterium]
MHARKILNISPPDSCLQDIFSKELGISRVLAQILINRGLKNIEDAQSFLNARLEHLLDPYSFSDMHKAISLIKKAAKSREKVLVFGDYDADGITSLALLKTTLLKIGLDVTHYLPHRIKEGYGLNKNVLRLAEQKSIKLLITVDCGTNNYGQIKELRRHNIEVIVTDHHEPLNNDLACCASAMINPKIKDSRYKYRDLAGVGVAYKLCQAITGQRLFEDLDLVSLGTIADVAPLTGENRIIVREGLSRISQTKRIGLRALMEISGIKDRKITSTFVSYILGPRLNASGRMDTAEAALSLLMSQEENEAKVFAQTLGRYNRQRQKIESKILKDATELIDKEVNFKEHKVIVIAKEDWHQGVLGIVASKLAERFYRPVIVISLDEDLCKGSGRSIKNFHLFEALSDCKDFLEEFGGHSHAVGLIITRDNIEDFKNKINRLAQEKLLLEDLIPSLDIDMELALADLNEAIITGLEVLEPFGKGNPEPLFYTRNLNLKDTPQALGRDTLKFWVTDGGNTYQAIGFGMGKFKDSLVNADNFDLVYTPRIDNWQGEENILLEAKDIFFRYSR